MFHYVRAKAIQIVGALNLLKPFTVSQRERARESASQRTRERARESQRELERARESQRENQRERGPQRATETLARMDWGNFLGKNLLDFRGSKPLPGWFGALFQI